MLCNNLGGLVFLPSSSVTVLTLQKQILYNAVLKVAYRMKLEEKQEEIDILCPRVKDINGTSA